MGCGREGRYGTGLGGVGWGGVEWSCGTAKGRGKVRYTVGLGLG